VKSNPFRIEITMASIIDNDPIIDSLLDELRAQLNALNDLHHPVYPANPRRIAELEARIAELKASLTARKTLLRSA
jgi:hypothetical protein